MQAINDSKEILIGSHVKYSEQKSVDVFYREHIFVLQAICGNVYFCLSDRKDLGDFSLHMFDETVVPDFIASCNKKDLETKEIISTETNNN